MRYTSRNEPPKRVHTCQNTIATLKIIGVDDFAFQKGRVYGTIIVDHEQGKVVDLLPDRSSKTLIRLRLHPEIEIITRDRSHEYAKTCSDNAPQAKQVLDRWHVRNKTCAMRSRIFWLAIVSLLLRLPKYLEARQFYPPHLGKAKSTHQSKIKIKGTPRTNQVCSSTFCEVQLNHSGGSRTTSK
jgi:transposase